MIHTTFALAFSLAVAWLITELLGCWVRRTLPSTLELVLAGISAAFWAVTYLTQP